MYVVCSKKFGKKKLITRFHRKRIILIRKRRKLPKSHILVYKNAQIVQKELICESHRQEKLHDEEIAVTKIKLELFLQICKKHSICQGEVGTFLCSTKTLSTNNYEICC